MSDSLKNKFLFYSPTEYEEKDYFANALIYVCENNDEGSLGSVSYTHLTLPTTP